METEKPAKKPFGPLETVGLTIVLFFATQIIAGLLITTIPLARHWSAQQVDTWLQQSVWATFLFVLLAETLTLGGLYWLIRLRNQTFATLGLNRPKLKYIGYALAGFVVYFAIYIIGLIIIKALVPSLNLEQKQELGFETSTTGQGLWPVFISLVILPPITEEIVARGFLFGGLRSKLRFVDAAVITSVLFAAAHLSEAKDGLLWVAGIDTFILSLVLCYLREKTGSLWPSIGVHMLKNGLAFIVLFNIFQYLR